MSNCGCHVRVSQLSQIVHYLVIRVQYLANQLLIQANQLLIQQRIGARVQSALNSTHDQGRIRAWDRAPAPLIMVMVMVMIVMMMMMMMMMMMTY